MNEYELRKRLFCAFFLIIFVPLPALFVIGIKGVIPYMEKAETGRMMKETMLTVGDVQATLKGFKSDVLILSESDELKDLVERDDARGRKRLANLFASFARHRGVYYQIRYIGENGGELVRVDDGAVVPDHKLQDKSDRYYFKESVGKARGEVYVSPLDLNEEWEKIEVPFRPVIRYATPVFDKRGARRGVVITNVDARRILQRLQGSADLSPAKIMLIDTAGYYLLHTDKNREWGGPADLNTGENVRKDYPEEVVEKFLSRSADVMVKKATVCSYAPIFTNNNEGNALIFIQENSFAGMMKTIRYLRSMIIIITLASAVAGVYLSYLLAGWLARISCKEKSR